MTDRTDAARVSFASRLSLAVALVLAVAACSTSATPTPLSGEPLRLAHGSGAGISGDSIDPGSPVLWTIDVANDASEPAVIDSYELVGESAGLSIVGAAGMSDEPGLAIGSLVPVTEAIRSAVAARPLVGWSFRPTTNPDAIPQRIVFLVAAPSKGDYTVNSVILRYHVGTQTFSSQFAAALDLCVGAAWPAAGASCPLPLISEAP